jgi:ABC-type lipoprotein export system ATPase subunit
VLTLLKRAAEERGATVLMATHSVESATRCDTSFGSATGNRQGDQEMMSFGRLFFA